MREKHNLKNYLFYEMKRIRMVEEAIADNYSDQEMRCPVHLSIGQEAAAVGVCSALKKEDWVFSGHRCHAHYLAKGGSLFKMIAEIYGKVDGCCSGKGGSMHLTDLDSGFIASTPIVGSTVPISVGAALTVKSKNQNRVVIIFLGDGAMEAGVVHESLNFASLKNLPIIFVCENNFYSVYSPLSVRQPKNNSLSSLAESHNVKSFYADGNNVENVFETTQECLKHIRTSGGPAFLELPTYRWREHCGPNFDNNIGYRTEEEFNYWVNKDPIKLIEKSLNQNILNTIEEELKIEIEKAFSFAKDSLPPQNNKNSQEVFA